MQDVTAENGVRVVSIKEVVLADNRREADALRARLRRQGTFMFDVMGSPGAGKTSLLIKTIEQLRDPWVFGVVEGDIASTLDAERMKAAGIDSIQLRTGGACHIDVPMMEEVLATLEDFESGFDVLALENVGNLVCPAEFDTGAHKRVMLLSIPEGYDKVFKYPLMFTVSDALVITKCDLLPIFDDYRMAAVEKRARELNPQLKIFTVSAKTGEGMEEWTSWLKQEIEAFQNENAE